MDGHMISLRTPWTLLLTSLIFTVVTLSPRIVSAAEVEQGTQHLDATVRLMVKVDPAAKSQIMGISTTSANNGPLATLGWDVLEVDASRAAELVSELQNTPGIIEVTEDYPLELTWTPNDPGFLNGEQWSLDKLGADIAWEFSTGESVTVAVIDSGIDHNHPDLVGRIVPGYNFIDDNADTTDLCGHGTHVAGIVAAATDNAVGVAGLAPQALIMPVKVIGENCQGSYSRLMQGIIYAVDQGARVISITSGGGFDHTALHDAIQYAREKGVLVAVSAGNRGNAEPFYPGSYEESFTVAGTDSNDTQYTMSNYGQQIDIAAPGVNIYSTFWRADEGSSYAYMTGTSMAAPHVAGVAALVLALDPKLSLADLETLLITSAVDLGEEGWDEIFGWGRLNAWRAVAAVSPATGNVRLGHYRVPQMARFDVADATVSADVDSIELSWTLTAPQEDQSVVIYRSPVPVFEAAEDIAKIAATAPGSYSDTSVEPGVTYTYWLVKADNDVEVAISDAISTQLATTPQEPETPEEPETPQEPETPEEPEAPQEPETPEEPEEPGAPVETKNPQEPRQSAQVALFMPLLQR